jgi:hypothetical protein
MTYSSTLAMNRQRMAVRNGAKPRKTWGKNQNTTMFEGESHRLGPVSNTILLLVLACILGLLYLTQVTKTNAYGYQVNDLQEQQTSLQTEHDELEVASARLQSLERVKNSEVANNLVSVASAGTVQN